jgi:type II secretory pathway pseudopilin PulG
MQTNGRVQRGVEGGFSVLELLVVVAILIVMIGVALFSLPTAQRALAVDNATDQMVDVLRFAVQRALAERQVMRVEIFPGTPTTPGRMVVIDEQTISGGADDDVTIRSESLAPNSEATVNTNALAFEKPPVPHNFEPAPFVAGKLELFFNPDGSVTNAGDVPQSFSLVLFTPRPDGTPDVGSIRSITLFGPTASVDEWRWDPEADAFAEN